MRREGDELEPTLSVPPTRHLPSSRPSVTVRASFSSSEAATSRITFASTRETTASAAAAPAAASFALEEGAAAAFAAATRGGGCVSSVEGFAATVARCSHELDAERNFFETFDAECGPEFWH